MRKKALTIAKRLIEGGWTEYQPNQSREVCDDCGAPLWVAPDGKSLYCNTASDKHTAKETA